MEALKTMAASPATVIQGGVPAGLRLTERGRCVLGCFGDGHYCGMLELFFHGDGIKSFLLPLD